MKATDEAAPAVLMTDDSIENLYALYEERVTRIVCKILSHGCVDPPDHIRDVKQDIYIKVKTSKYDSSRGEFRPWVSAIARNAAIDHIKRWCDISTQSIEDAEVKGLLGEAPAERGEARIHGRILLTELWVKLNDHERELARLSYIVGLSYKEIAQRLGIDENAVRQRRFRLERKLQKLRNQTK